MQSTITPTDGSIVKIVIDLDEAELEPSVNTALNKIAKDVRIPGFRQGKVPRKVLEAKLGRSYIRAEAINDAVPGFLDQAIRENGLDVIATQSLNIKSGEESGPIVFEADVELRPEVTIIGYKGARVTVPSPHVSEADVEAQVTRLREQFGELREVDRPVGEDDQVTISVKAERDGEPVPGVSVEDFLYRVAGDTFLSGLDEAIIGHSAGEEVSFTIPAPEAGEQSAISCIVSIQKVSQLDLPELSDEWASEASEFETLEELRKSIRDQLADSKLSRAKMAFRDRAVSALIDLMAPAELPEALQRSEFDRIVHDFSHRLESQGITVEQYISVTGSSSEELVSQLMAQAQVQAKADLVLRALVRDEGVTVEPAEIDKEISSYADAAGTSIDAFRERIVASGQIKVIELELAKMKALDDYLATVDVIDEEGNAVERDLLLGENNSQADGLAESADSGKDDMEQISSGGEPGESV